MWVTSPDHHTRCSLTHPRSTGPCPIVPHTLSQTGPGSPQEWSATAPSVHIARGRLYPHPHQTTPQCSIRACCPTVHREVWWSGLVTHIHSQPHGNSTRRQLFLALGRAVVWVCGATIWNFIIRKSGLLERRVGHTGLWSRNCGGRVEWRTEREPPCLSELA